MKLAQKAGLRSLADERLSVPTDKGANAGLKVSSLVGGMVAGADSIDDMAVLRHGAMGKVLDRPYAPTTLGSFLRTFTFGLSANSMRRPTTRRPAMARDAEPRMSHAAGGSEMDNPLAEFTSFSLVDVTAPFPPNIPAKQSVRRVGPETPFNPNSLSSRVQTGRPSTGADQ